MLFFTGFPGFLGSELIRELLSKHPNQKALCLVQKKFFATAEQHLKHYTRDILPRVELIEGDITLPHLGLSEKFIQEIAPEITQIFHLAAVYDLNVEEHVGMMINVEGTRNMIEFAKSCPSLARFQYVSTCYVSGRYHGTFQESDLTKEQKFNNFYESTKYLAEVEVQKAMKAGLPCSIYRPAVVVGNSHTGETQKFDGPYFVLQWLIRQPGRFAILPTVFTRDCDVENCYLDLVPSDFVIKGIAYLSQKADTKNEVFQLADPMTMRIPELIHEFERVLHKKIIQIPIPLWLARFALKHVPFLQRFMGIPYAALNYFSNPTRYDVRHTTRHLQGSGIVIPHFKVYLPHLVSYMKANWGKRNKAMI